MKKIKLMSCYRNFLLVIGAVCGIVPQIQAAHSAQKNIACLADELSQKLRLSSSSPITIKNEASKKEELLASSPSEENEIMSGSSDSSFNNSCESSSEDDSFDLWKHEDQLRMRIKELKDSQQDSGGTAFLAIEDIQQARAALNDVRSGTSEAKDLNILIDTTKKELYNYTNTLNESAKLRLLWCLAAPVLKFAYLTDTAMITLLNQLTAKKHYKKNQEVWFTEANKCLSEISDDVKVSLLSVLGEIGIDQSNKFYQWVSRINAVVTNTELRYDNFSRSYTQEKHYAFSMNLKMPEPYR